MGKTDNGVVSVTSLWADERLYYPVEVEPYPSAFWYDGGKADPAFRTKPEIALELVQHAVALGFVFRAVVADRFYGEPDGFCSGVGKLGLGYVLALKPSHAWWHRGGAPSSFQDIARAAGWKGSHQPAQWVSVIRTFSDGHSEPWWALQAILTPVQPEPFLRTVLVTTEPDTLPEATTCYLSTNLPTPHSRWAQTSALPAADLAEGVRLYGLRMWVEQSYKQVKTTLDGAQYQVRSDRAIRRHWTLVCCAFSFSWWHASHVFPERDQPSRRWLNPSPLPL